MPRRSSVIVVGLDIGTTKIAAVVGEVGPDGLDIIGVGTHPSRGLKKGVIVNIGFGDHAKLFPRSPRLTFSEIASFV